MVAEPRQRLTRALVEWFRLPDGQPYSWSMFIATAALMVAFAGDVLRYTIGWVGYGLVVGAIVTLAAGVLLRRRPKLRLRHLPTMLLLFVLWCAMSVVWSEYRAETLVACAVQLGTALVALMMAVTHTRMQWLRSLGSAMRWLVVASLVFELWAAVFVPGGVIPPTYLRPGALATLLGTSNAPDPIPASFYWTHADLFHAGPLQGIMGNRNLLAMVALIALVVTTLEVIDRMIAPWYGYGSMALAATAIALTESATVYVALGFCLLAAALVMFGRRWRRRWRWLMYLIVGCGLALGAWVVVRWNNEVFALMNRSSDMSGRGVIWRAVLAFGGERPITGHGWISYWAPWLPQFHDLAVIDGMAYHQAHNAFIDTFMQLGAVGVLLFIGLVLSTLIRTWWIAIEVTDTPRVRPLRGRDRLAAVTAAPFVLMVALVVQAMTESRLLVEGGWLLLCYFAVYARLRIQDSALLPRRTLSTRSGLIVTLLDPTLDP